MRCNPDRGRCPDALFDARRESALDLLCDLVSLERSALAPAVRADCARLDALLHPEFEEFGRSGAHHRRADVLQRLPRETASNGAADIEAFDFRIQVLGADCAQLLYSTREPRGLTRRSSLWVRTAGCWQLRFHQGTPCSELAESAESDSNDGPGTR